MNILFYLSCLRVAKNLQSFIILEKFQAPFLQILSLYYCLYSSSGISTWHGTQSRSDLLFMSLKLCDTQQLFPTPFSLAGNLLERLKMYAHFLNFPAAGVTMWQTNVNELGGPWEVFWFPHQRSKMWGTCFTPFPSFLPWWKEWCAELGSHVQPQKNKQLGRREDASGSEMVKYREEALWVLGLKTRLDLFLFSFLKNNIFLV